MSKDTNTDDETLEDFTETISIATEQKTEEPVLAGPIGDVEIIDDHSLIAVAESEVINEVKNHFPEEETNPEIQSDYQREIDTLSEAREKLVAAAPQLLSKVESEKQETSKLNEWIDRQHTSFLWKVLSRMKSNTDLVNSKLSEYQDYVNAINIPESGRLHKLRKRFHKSLGIAWLVVFVIAGVLLSLPKLAENISGDNFLLRLVTNQSYPSNSKIVFTAGYVLLLTLTSLLIQYYRDWSIFERKVLLTLWKLDVISQSVRHCRDEHARLATQYPQVRDWLEIIGNSLHKPWKIDKKWLQPNLNEIPQNDFPYALRIAQAQEDDNSSSLAMRRHAAERFLIRGWRARVFTEQVRAAQEIMGLTENRLNVESLDSDIAWSPGGPRAILRKKIIEDELLTTVAKRELIPLMKIVQVESIATARPPVSENRTDVLNSLKPDDLGLGIDRKVPWDAFLTQSMGDSDKPRTPLSLLAFSESGRQVGHHDRSKSIFISPDRLIANVPNNDSSFVYGYNETTRLPMDIVVRMDIVGPLPQGDVMILESSIEEIEQGRSSYQESIRSSIDLNKSGV